MGKLRCAEKKSVQWPTSNSFLELYLEEWDQKELSDPQKGNDWIIISLVNTIRVYLGIFLPQSNSLPARLSTWSNSGSSTSMTSFSALCSLYLILCPKDLPIHHPIRIPGSARFLLCPSSVTWISGRVKTYSFTLSYYHWPWIQFFLT